MKQSNNTASIISLLLRLLPTNLNLLIYLIIYLLLINVNVDDFELQNDTEKTFKVEIKGEVIHPGVYETNSGKTVDDLLKLAIPKAKADLDSINKSLRLKPNLVIVVEEKRDKRISINNATIEELCLLDGIKEGLASRIIEYRKLHGGFKSLEELKDVKGIGETKYKQIKENIRL